MVIHTTFSLFCTSDTAVNPLCRECLGTFHRWASLLPISSGFCLVWSTENRLRKASDCRRGKLDGKSQGGIVTCRRIVCLSSCLSPSLLQPLFSSPRFALHVHLLDIASISSLGVFVVMFMQVYCLCWLLMCDCLADASVLNSRIVTQLC